MNTYSEKELHAMPDAEFNRVVAEMAGFSRSFTPNFATSIDTAWALIDERLVVDLFRAESGKNTEAQLMEWTDKSFETSEYECWEAEHTQPARALATAWVLWKQERTP